MTIREYNTNVGDKSYRLKDGQDALNIIVREAVSNYLDDGDFELIGLNDQLTLKSDGSPTLGQLLVNGETTKIDIEKAIGIHGEGFLFGNKLALDRRNTTVTITCKLGGISFLYKKVFGVRVVHVEVDTSKKTSQFITTIEAKGVMTAYRKMFLPQEQLSEYKILKVNQNEKTKLYCKGVYVNTFPDMKSRYHWNVPVELNRNRDIPDIYSVHSAMRTKLERDMTKEFALELLENPDTIEARLIGECSWLYGSTEEVLHAAFTERYGSNAVIQSNETYTNEKAIAKGFRPVVVPDVFRTALRGAQVELADDKVTKADTFTEVFDVPKEYFQEIEKLMDILNVPAHVRSFEDMDDGSLGHAIYNNSRSLTEIWINETLMRPGMRQKRLMTACHELGHCESTEDDCTSGFEYSLSQIAGKLAELVLNK